MKLLIKKIDEAVDYSSLSSTIQRNIVSYKTTKPAWKSVSKKGRELVRNHYFKEQGQRCAYCGKYYDSKREMEVEHIAPSSKYGEFVMEPQNLCLVCPVCNQLKGNVDTIVFPYSEVYNNNTFEIFHPHFDEPTDIFGVCFDYILKGIDPAGKGVWTIEKLELNVEERIKTRVGEEYRLIIEKEINEQTRLTIKKAGEYIKVNLKNDAENH